MPLQFAKVASACVLCGLVAAAQALRAQDNPPLGPPPAKSAAKAAAGKAGEPAAPADYLLVPGFWSLGLKGVQKEIALTAEQKTKLKEISDGYRAFLRQHLGPIQSLPPQEQQKKLAEVREEAGQVIQATRKKAAAVLTQRQAETVRKIDLELRAAGYLGDPSLQEHLGLTETQRRRLQQVLEESHEKVQQLQREIGGRMLEILTPEQVQEFTQRIENPPPPPENREKAGF
jgi:Spy/CpxP family protein refolding chaperone